MGRFKQTSQFVGRDQGDIVTFAAVNDDLLTVFGHFVEEGLQIRARLCIGRFDWHERPLLPICTELQYMLFPACATPGSNAVIERRLLRYVELTVVLPRCTCPLPV